MMMMHFIIEDEDYVPGPYNLTFPAGVTNVPLFVQIINDDIQEDNEDFELFITDTVTSLP